MTATPEIESALRKAQQHLQARRFAAAAQTLRRAAEIAPDDPRVDLLTASTAGARHDHAGVLVAIDRAIGKGLDPPPQIRFARIHALYTLGRLADALAEIDAIAPESTSGIAPPGSPLAHNLLGLRAKCLERDGDLDDLAATLDRLGAIEGPSPRLERIRATVERRRGDRDAAIARLEAILTRPHLAPPDRVGVGFDLARLLDAAGRFDDAFAAAAAANEVAPPPFDAAADARTVDAIIAATDAATMNGLPRSSVDSPQPVFIVGMPRSGTSLLEQVIAAHPHAAGVGERQDPFILLEDLELEAGTVFPQAVTAAPEGRLDAAAAAYLRMLKTVAGDAARVTNKALGLDRVVGFLAAILPGARFIWIHRDPRDAILSAYLHQIHQPWAWRLADLAAAHDAHRRLREHWTSVLPDRSLVVRYETMVADPDPTIDAAIGFLGLPPDPACHRFHESARAVMTPSHDQVRRPMNASAIDRWKRYQRHLGGLL
jgi:tetratricopeptide (TPR) repeat protein